MLWQVCCREILTFLQTYRWTNDVHNWFLELQKIFRKKMFHWKLEGIEFSLVYVMRFAATKKPFRNQLHLVMITYPFSFQEYSSSMLESTFSALYIITSRMSTFLSRTQFFPHFLFIFFLLNKTIQLPFHDYIALLSLP